MDLSRTASPAPSESVFSESALTQLEGDVPRPLDVRLRLERAGSTTSSTGGYDLANLNLVSLSRPWNDDSQPASRRGFHAISTVLNHPTKRAAPLRASRIPLPPGPAAEVFPKVNRNDIDAYVQTISPEWDRFERARSTRDDTTLSPPGGEDGRPEGARLVTPVVTERGLPGLGDVPDVFFEPDFNIGNPHIFDVVTEQTHTPQPATPVRPSFASPTPSSPSPLPTLNPLPATDSHPSSPLPSTTPRPSTVAFPPQTPSTSRGSSTPRLVGGPIEDTTTNQALQDKLSSYLDVVEQHLVLEISRRSSSFFAALTNLQDLQSESSSCLSRIDSLRSELVALDQGQAQRGLEVVRLQRTLGGLKRVEGAVREVRGVEEAVGMIRSLVANGDGFGAVEIWEEVDGWLKRKGKGKEREPAPPPPIQPASSSPRPSPRNSPRFRPTGLSDLDEVAETDELTPLASTSTSALLAPPGASRPTSPSPPQPPPIHRKTSHSGARYPPTDLTTTASLSHLPQTLSALALAIATQLETELQAVLANEMSKPHNAAEGGSQVDEVLKDLLSPLVQGLIRVREGGRLVGVYREVAIGEIREAVKKNLPAGAAEEDEPATGRVAKVGAANGAAAKPQLGKALKDLDHTEFLALEKAMFGGLIACIRTIEVFSRAIEAILDDANTPDSSLTYSLPAIKGDLADVLSNASELANSRASKIIGVRNEQHAALQLGQFLEMFSEAWTFVIACEVICRKMIVGLRGTMVVQAKTFLQTYHSQRVSSSARLVENELWAPEETTPTQQHAVDLLVESAVSDPVELVILATSSPDRHVNGSTNGEDGKTGNKKHLQIEDRSYFVVGATLGSLELLVDYIKIVLNIDLLTTDVMSKIIEYLKSFNSRTCQVVLGAGAMRSAGLKNITAKHLALASQSLSVMIALIPYIRETLRRHLNQKQAVMLVEFDKLKRDYQEHQNEIHAKLVAIMGDRLALHLKALREIEWEAPSRRPGKPNEYIELLVKETTQLHKILSRYLPDQTVDSVASQVFAAINHGLSEAYSGIEVRSEDAKARLLLDATHLHAKLSVLPNTTPISAVLVTLVKDKPTPRLPVGASMKNLMRRVSNRSDSGGGGPPSPSAERDNPSELLGSGLATPEIRLGTDGSSGIATPVSEVESSAGDGGEGDNREDGPEVVVSPADGEDQRSSSPLPSQIRLPPSPLANVPLLPADDISAPSLTLPPPSPPTVDISAPPVESDLPSLPPPEDEPQPPATSEDDPSPLPPPKEKVEATLPSVPVESEQAEAVTTPDDEGAKATAGEVEDETTQTEGEDP